MITSLLSVVGVLLAGEPTAAAVAPQQAERPPADAILTDLDPVEFTIDPRAFFEELVNRYRNLAVYRDVTRVVQITQHRGDQHPVRVETEVSSDITDDSVTIDTPGAQLRRLLGLNLPFKRSEHAESIQYRYERWLLPHLSLRLAEEPLRDFREGVSEGFTATEAATVTVDNRSMVHLELKSGDGLSNDSDARFDLYVDPESMLVERIQGEQRLPDGGRYETDVQISPRQVEARTPETVDAPEASTPTDPPHEPSFPVQTAWDEHDEPAATHPPLDGPSQPASPLAGGAETAEPTEPTSEHAAGEPAAGSGSDIPTRSREPSSGEAPASSGGSTSSGSSDCPSTGDDPPADPPSKPQGRPIY